VADPAARVTLPDHPRLRAEWCHLPAGAPVGEALFDAVRGTEVPPEARVWAAGEAAAVQRIRRHLFDDRGLPRAAATIRGYWKHGRRGDG
jgi:NADPH-dependent ferric siderophore reductase